MKYNTENFHVKRTAKQRSNVARSSAGLDLLRNSSTTSATMANQLASFGYVFLITRQSPYYELASLMPPSGVVEFETQPNGDADASNHQYTTFGRDLTGLVRPKPLKLELTRC